MILGIDLGGTQIRGGLVGAPHTSIISRRIQAYHSRDEVLQQVFAFIDTLFDATVQAIGVGVPGLVDPASGMVYDVMNIPAWKEVPLQQHLEARYQVPVRLNNDANCFALGEFHFGKGIGHDSMVGLAIGTGLGSGLIINKKLYSGAHGGSGEFGMVSYLDKYYEFYASGQFFKNVYDIDGEVVYEQARKGSANAIAMYHEMGTHLGNAIKTIMFTLDTNLIILGGSVRHAYDLFSTSMWQQVQTFPFKRSVNHLQIEVSELENSGVMGAAALHL